MTTESSSALFTVPSNAALLRRLVQDLRTLPSEAIPPEGMTHHLAQIVDLMISNPEKFDEFAAVNVEWIGASFMGEIKNYFDLPPENRPSVVRSVFTSAYRFLCELEFTQPGEPSFEVRRIMNFVHDHLEDFTGTDRQQLIYAAYAMPAQVAKRLIGHPSVTEFRKFSETVEASRKIKEEWDKDLDERQKLLQGLASNIGNITSAYNFVGLVHGFQGLKEKKEEERKFSFVSIILIGLAMTVLPLAQLSFVAINLETIESHKGTLVYTLPTIIAIEIILLYFFRVVLGQFRSVKAQLLQIDLRVSLCQFIESYADYVTKLRNKDSSALSKFEALVFSGLVTEESGIPSTFDGAEQIASLIRSIRGGAKE
ncbi:hypothetical protein [Rhodoferax ferrireducens]|uniref:hypothetical protein n=1 Tax=Rhodoferax ferrireducens TaxID=192843 RepID=UPI000E0DEAFE|nr:hypothetical protein [Rhodoferax ferrireducens]